MIPVELLDSLVDRFGDELKDIRVKNLKNEHVSLNIYPQHLPAKSKNGTDPYPAMIIRLGNGDKSEANEAFSTKILFIIGVIDRESSNQGFRDAISIGNKVIESLQRNPNELGKYEMVEPINWAYHDEDVEPYFFVGLETTWDTPSHIREDVEDLI